jgi:hypothetical protein
LLGDDAAPLSRASRGLRDELPAQVRAWQARVLELVSQQGQQRRLTARVAALGINTTGILVMIAVFLHTGGLTGGEIAVAGGTGVVGQRVLEAIFGDAAVRALSEQAREDLLTRLDALLDPERERFLARLPSPEAADAAGVELRAALAAVARARRERATA